MALARDFRETIKTGATSDATFRAALVSSALALLLS
jgi:hypothetical protein